MATLQPYKKYNSVVYDYVNQLPEGWQLLPNIAIFQERIERGYENEELLSVTIARGIIKQSELDKKDSSTLDKSKYLLVYPDDLVYSMRFRQGASGYSNYKGIVSPACTVLRPRKNVTLNSRFFYYMFRTGFYKNYVERFAYGIADGQMPLRYVDFKRMYSIVPPLEVQNNIVAYLDKKNNEIDKFIRNKERLIELLEEQKQSVVRRLVTKGLNSKTNFVETEINWIGQIPENWKIKKLKYCSKIIYGISPHENTYNDNGIGSVLVNGPVEYSDENFGYTRELKWTTDPKKFAPKDALLFCLRGSTTGRLNICHADVSIGRGVAAIISKTHQDFMVYAVKALVDFISDSFKGSTFPSVTSEDLNNYLIPLPSTIEEEIEIVKFLNNETKIFDLAISKAQKEISSIKEYREALITDLVTGKRQAKENEVSITVKSNTANWEFKEAVLISFLTDKFSSAQYPLGRKRYTKLSYLFHRYTDNKIEKYLKKAAGPYNPDTKYKGPEKIAKQNEYIKDAKSGNYSGFVVAEKINSALDYFNKYWTCEDIAWIEKQRRKTNDELELIATVDNAILELQKQEVSISLNSVRGFIESTEEWKDKLKREIFNDINIKRAISEIDTFFS